MVVNKPIQFKNIILWRHAEAVDLINCDSEISHSISHSINHNINHSSEQDDLSRALTSHGQQQAKKMAQWLTQHLPNETNFQCSPALRAFQTADALKYKININQAFKPGINLQQALSAMARLPCEGNLLLVGHQPYLGQLAGYLLGISELEIHIKKGAIWWLRRLESEPGRYQIMTVQTPSKL